jgi:hypothetical protein
MVIVCANIHHLMEKLKIEFKGLVKVPKNSVEVVTYEVTRLKKNRKLKWEVKKLKEKADKAKV